MKRYSLLITLLVCGASGLTPGPARAQGADVFPGRRALTEAQLDAIVKPSLAQCEANRSRIDAASVIPTRSAREYAAS